jgi:superfamily II DNA or RNA helicase
MKNHHSLLLKATDWASFKAFLKTISEKEKGDCFEALAKAFLQIHPQYCTKLKNVWLLNEVPLKIREFVNIPNRDEGIDLIAETKDDQIWAIQCKYIDDENQRLNRSTIATFTDLAFTVCKNISFALICTTADRYSYKLSMYGERLGFCSGDIWRQLDGAFFEQVHALLEGKPVKFTPAVPRDHQKEALTEAVSYFSDSNNYRGKLIMPCGTGKGLTSYWIAEALNAQSILIAVPSLALIRQSLEVWTKESIANNRDIDWICVCSDETVSEIERDDAVVLTQDLGIRVHTNIDEITVWLKEDSKKSRVVFSTYQSGKAIAEAASRAGVVFELGIFDEAHKTVGNADSLFSFMLHDQNISIKKRVFMTATERRYLGQSEQIASMDDSSLYGETFYLLSFKKALEADPPILCDYKIITMLVEKSEIYELIRKNVFVKPDRGKWDEEVEAEMLAAAVALRKAMAKNPIKHAVSFHKSIARARAFKAIQDKFTEGFPEYGTLDSFHVSGKTPTGSRAREIESFANADRALITNARCLTEGVDVPTIDCVLFADPKKSTVDIVQAIGRALRPSPNKQAGFILIPVVVDSAFARIETLRNSAFSSVLTVLRALGANDDRIVDYFRAISQGKRVTGGIIDFDFGVRNGIALDSVKFVGSIELSFWSRLSKLSWKPFEEARAYVQNIGLTGRYEWENFCKNELSNNRALPSDIPRRPDYVYKDNGWKSWGDWLGTGNIAFFLREYRSFEEARAYVQSLHLSGENEWRMLCNNELPNKGTLPSDIPSRPDYVYKDNGWKNWGDWLGTGNVAKYLREYLPFMEAREFVRGLGLKSQAEWLKFCKGQLPEKGMLPKNVPTHPDQTYKNKGWENLGDWLGTGNIANRFRKYIPFEQAREFVRRSGLTSSAEWLKFCRGQLSEKGTLPLSIPSNPHMAYKGNGWKNWGDWLGTGTIAPMLREYLPFEEAREFVRGLGLKGQAEWRKFCKGQLPEKGTLPLSIPFKPDHVYKDNGWTSMGDWLGTGTIAHKFYEYLPFEEAREFVSGLGLKSSTEWWKFCKGQLPEKGSRPINIPSQPHEVYKDNGWKSMGDWLGTGNVAKYLRECRSFYEAREFVRGLGLKSSTEWRNFCRGQLPEKGKLPEDIPTNPHRTYKNKGWKGFGDWLGTGNMATHLRSFRPFEEAREFVHGLGLKNVVEWRDYCKGRIPEKRPLPKDIPARPDDTYKGKGWKGMGDWLGVTRGK